ncbi:acyl-CoA thioesterase [Salegentibacter sp. UBA1130]|jgi:acyl-CoA thioester hydrolase|uniref:acyl-CoA thioesterase n=1 Tax=Salegentibacter sp. UBA1130 TaxID=1947451 RepID=UPI0025794CA1|nr:acyl-CoA thioesterase [Salegentibacter sp. UBA1130]|tara:strand:+ start:348 stop:758 length:411 start_codon:yes stop_codon:yes gene_type:complete
MESETYNLKLELRIDWSDLDMYKHVNNISFMRYMQSGRVNFWEASGIYEMYENTNMGTMLVSTHCDFKKSLYYPGKAIVKTRIDFIKNSSFGLKHLILNDINEVCAEGKDVVVCYDFEKDNTFRIPEDLRTQLSKF